MPQSTKGRVAKNAIVLILTDVMSKVFAMVLTITVARFLGVADFGLFNYSCATAFVCLVIADFGFDRLTIREISRRPWRASRFLSNISIIKFVLYIPGAAACALIVLLTSRDYTRLLIVIVVFFAVATQQHIQFLLSFFRARQEMEREGLMRFILSVLLFLGGLIVLYNGLGIKGLVFSNMAISLLSLGLSVMILKRTIGLTFKNLSLRYSKILIKLSAPLSVFVILSVIFNSINVIILNLLTDDRITGFYSASFKLISLFSVLSAGLSAATLPELSKTMNEFPLRFNQTMQTSIRYLTVLSVPISVGTFLLGDHAIKVIYGSNYFESGKLIKYLSFLIIPSFLNDIVTAALTSMKREKVMVIGSIIGVLLITLLCFILIPRWGATGAVWALVITDSVIFFFRLPSVYREFGIKTQLIIFGRVVLATCLMGIILIFLRNLGTHLSICVIISTCAYIVGLLAVKEIRFGEVADIWKLFRRFQLR
jgi:O-antigen/teichoic acid export membrane protein